MVHIFGSSGCNAASSPIEEVGLRLLSGLGLEAALELGCLVRPDRAEIIRYRRVAAFVAELPDLPASRQFWASFDLVRQIILE